MTEGRHLDGLRHVGAGTWEELLALVLKLPAFLWRQIQAVGEFVRLYFVLDAATFVLVEEHVVEVGLHHVSLAGEDTAFSVELVRGFSIELRATEAEI